MMNAARRRFLASAGAVIAAPLVARMARGQAQTQAQVTLRLHHFLPAVANAHARFLLPWSKKIEAASAGRMRINIFPSMQLGGTPAQLFDQASDGTADIVWTLPGNTPGRFPIVEVFELPFVASRRSIVNAKAVQDFADSDLKQEFRDVHPICVWAHDHGLIHARKPINAQEDLRGLKLRSPTRLAGEALRALGANPIGMAVPQVPEALILRAIDGCVVPWEVAPALRVPELLKFHTDIPGSPTLYTATFILAMNKPKYDALPADLKEIIDANGGQAMAATAGQMWDDQAAVALEAAKARGNTITTLTPDETARWRKTTEPVIEAWLKQMKERGQDGGKLLAKARALLAKYEQA
jgi:TRAP-type C4-dicarboxylate transport system substrate-binding protein